MIELKVLTVDDWPLWRELRLGALGEAPYAYGSQLADWQGDGDRPERWRARLAIPGSYNLAALIDDQPVGIASGVPADVPGEIEVISVWVSPVGRGRGVGDRLINAITEWASDQGAHVVHLAVTDGNEQATALYRRNGFDHTGELGDLMPDGVRRERIMAKQLRP